MSKTVNAKLYKIHESIINDRDNNEELIGEIIQNYFNRSGNQFIEVNLNNDLDTGEWQSKLFVYTTTNKPADWQDFLSGIVSNNADIEKLNVQYSSFVLFIYSHEAMFAISKGYYGHFLLEEYIDEFFGLEVLSRLINKSTTEIRQIEERGVFGIEVGALRFFRENYNLAFDDDFGKIYKTMLASIEEEDFNKLGIVQKRTNIKKLSITGSGSFEVSSKFSFRELLTRIIKIQELLQTEGVQFNQFYRVPSAQLAPIKDELNNDLLKKAYQVYNARGVADFYSPNVIDYLRSIEVQFYNDDGVSHEIEFCSSRKYCEIIDELIENYIIDATDEDSFVESFKSSFGQYKHNEESPYSVGISLEKWICGEIDYEEKKYFKLDNIWYLYRETLDEYLNTYFETFDFESFTPETPLDSWIGISEGEYNENYKGVDNFIVGDRAYLKYIEMADLIKVTDSELVFYHVKQGLGQDTRALINQIANAARFLTYFKDEENSQSLRTYYASICNKHYDGNEIMINYEGVPTMISENDFVNLFKSNRKFTFVFAYGSDSDMSIRDEIIASQSRIAKLSLIYIIRDIKRTDFTLLFERIATA